MNSEVISIDNVIHIQNQKRERTIILKKYKTKCGVKTKTPDFIASIYGMDLNRYVFCTDCYPSVPANTDPSFKPYA